MAEKMDEKTSQPPAYTRMAEMSPPLAMPPLQTPTAPGVAAPMMSFSVQVGPYPATVSCPSCNHVVVTKVEHKATSRTHMSAVCLFVFCCWLCCCIPYCMDSCRNANHYCPNCGAFIGTYQS